MGVEASAGLKWSCDRGSVPDHAGCGMITNHCYIWKNASNPTHTMRPFSFHSL